MGSVLARGVRVLVRGVCRHLDKRRLLLCHFFSPLENFFVEEFLQARMQRFSYSCFAALASGTVVVTCDEFSRCELCA